MTKRKLDSLYVTLMILCCVGHFFATCLPIVVVFYLRRRRLCFHFGLFVCLSVCLSVYPSDNWKSCERILTKFLGGVGHGPGTNEVSIVDDPHHYPDPGVRSGTRSGSGKNCHNSIMLAFGGGLCSLSTSSFFLLSIFRRIKSNIYVQVRHTRCWVWMTRRLLLASYRAPLTGCFDSSMTRRRGQERGSRSACRQLRSLASRSSSEIFLPTPLLVKLALNFVQQLLSFVWAYSMTATNHDHDGHSNENVTK